jgi:hypothetical protein
MTEFESMDHVKLGSRTYLINSQTERAGEPIPPTPATAKAALAGNPGFLVTTRVLMKTTLVYASRNDSSYRKLATLGQKAKGLSSERPFFIN